MKEDKPSEWVKDGDFLVRRSALRTKKELDRLGRKAEKNAEKASEEAG